LANHKSALKRAKQSEVKRLINQTYKTRVKNSIKDVRSAIAANTEDQAKETLKKAVSIIRKSASKGAIHKKNAARKVSRLTRQVNQIPTQS
jgi:small subunit ribosomal protein S20